MQSMVGKGRTVLLSALIVLLVASLAACSSGKQNTAQSEAQPSSSASVETGKGLDPVKLTMWVRTPETVGLIEKAADGFKAQSGHTVEVVPYAADQYQAALQAAISGNNLPDILQMHNTIPLAQMKKLDLIQPLPFDQAFIDRFDPATWWEGSTVLDGEIYGWPDRSFHRGSLVVFYNKKVMQEYGLNPDQPPATWDEFLAQSKQVTSQSGGKVIGVTTGMKAAWFAERLISQLATTVEGGGIFMETLPGKLFDWKTGTAFTAEPAIEAFRYLETLKEEKVIDPDFVVMDRPDAAAKFGENQAAFLIDGHWRLNSLHESYPDLEFGLTSLPSKTGTPAYWGVEGGSGNAFVLSKNVKDVEVAVQWFEYLSDHFYPELLTNAIDLTPIPDINNADDIEMIPEFRELIELTGKIVKVQPSPGLRNANQIDVVVKMLGATSKEPLGQSIQAYLSGKSGDVADYLRKYGEEQQKFLEDALASVPGADPEDWKFPDWNMAEDYTPDKYK